MRRFRRGVLLTAMLFSLGCYRQHPMEEPGRFRVVTTTTMIADAVVRIGGEKVRVRALMGPGIDPHSYKASERDVIRLLEADLILYHGLHLEAKMTEVLARLHRRKPSHAVTAAIPRERLISEGSGDVYDPHLWFDISLWSLVVQHIAQLLAEHDPIHKEYYQKQLALYQQELMELHLVSKRVLEVITPQTRVLITAHDAFRYFGRAYQIEVKGLQGISTVTEAGAADMRELADFIALRRIPSIFVENSIPPKSIEALRAAVHARGFAVQLGGELYSDSLGNPGTSEGSYIGMVRHNVTTIARALMQGESIEKSIQR